MVKPEHGKCQWMMNLRRHCGKSTNAHGTEEGLGSRHFTRMLNQLGGRDTAIELLQPRAGNVAQPGFRDLMTAGRPDLTLESVVLEPRFQELFNQDVLNEARRRLGLTADPAISTITAEIERQARGRSIGGLQQLRKKIKGLSRLPSRTIFRKGTTFDNYAFHYGGRTELQFNIGLETLDDGHRYLRHGVAISLQTNLSFHDIDDAMLSRIERFNEFIETYPDEFSEFLMYHTDDKDENERWSGDYKVRAIGPEIVRLGIFIFLGRRQAYNAVSVEQILRDFDRLLPLYEYVEGKANFPELPGGKPQERPSPGLTKKPSRTTMSTVERQLDKELRHNVLQYALGRYLIEKHGENCVWDEFPTGNGTKVDLAVRIGDGMIFYEIKTRLSARGCIREALGQLLEYAYWPGTQPAKELIIVGEAKLDTRARTYLEALRREFSLPIEYKNFNLTKGTLT